MVVKNMFIIGGTASKTVAEEIAKKLQQPLAHTTIKRFPDGELYVRILDAIEGEHVVIIQTTYPDPNIIELLLLQDAVHEAGARTITTVIPYFGYSRQDKKFEPGEPISARALAEHISLRASKVILVDPHKEHLLNFFNKPAYGCSVVPDIAKYLKKKNIDLVLAPDKGAIHRAQQASQIINCKYDYIEKTRIDSQTVQIKPKNLEVTHKKVAIIDDIISTGGTMAKSIKELKTQGAEKILAACTHGIFAEGAIEKLTSAGCDDIISTDTIPSAFSHVKIAPCIAEALVKFT